MSGRWVFGYGSLVSPASFGHTIGRELRTDEELFEAELAGFGRRWNYGVMGWTAESVGDDGTIRTWTIVALGVVAAADESVNGVVAWIDDPDELARLDRRERHYDRVDVTSLTTVHAPVDGPVETYVPRPEAVANYEDARDRGEAAIEQRYWDLVDGAFGDLGADRRARYHSTTPAPDIPVVAMRGDRIPARYDVR